MGLLSVTYNVDGRGDFFKVRKLYFVVGEIRTHSQWQTNVDEMRSGFLNLAILLGRSD
jgi:hypothetical protein